MIVIYQDRRVNVDSGSLEFTEAEARAIYEQLRARFKPSKKKGWRK